MALITEGTTLQIQPSEIEADSTSGSVVIRYVGTRDELEAYAVTLGLPTSGHKWAIRNTEGPFAELSWTIATGPGGSSAETDDPITTDWEFSTPSAMVPLSEHPDWADNFDRLKRADPLLNATVLSFWKGEIPYEAIGESAITTLKTDYPWIIYAIDANQEGVTGYFRGEITLSVVDRYQRQAPWIGFTATINKVYTTAGLISLLRARAVNAIPSDISNSLPSGEWLTESVIRHASSDGSREVTQTFRHAPKWRDFIYTHA